jgi:hypothetical protein
MRPRLDPVEVRLVLRELRPDVIEFGLVDEDGWVRGVTVTVSPFGRPCFPSITSDTTASLGSDEADAWVRERAGEELVRLEAATRLARRSANGVRDELGAGYWRDA